MSEPRSFHNGRVLLHAGDCLEVLDAMEENSVDAVVCRRSPRKSTGFYTTDACCPACKEKFGFFPPAICGHNNLSSRDVWYDRKSCSWTIDNPDGSPTYIEPWRQEMMDRQERDQ